MWVRLVDGGFRSLCLSAWQLAVGIEVIGSPARMVGVFTSMWGSAWMKAMVE